VFLPPRTAAVASVLQLAACKVWRGVSGGCDELQTLLITSWQVRGKRVELLQHLNQPACCKEAARPHTTGHPRFWVHGSDHAPATENVRKVGTWWVTHARGVHTRLVSLPHRANAVSNEQGLASHDNPKKTASPVPGASWQCRDGELYHQCIVCSADRCTRREQVQKGVTVI
jgi:hypothetical protein